MTIARSIELRVSLTLYLFSLVKWRVCKAWKLMFVPFDEYETEYETSILRQQIHDGRHIWKSSKMHPDS